MRLNWVRDEMKKLTEERWSVEKAIGLMIDAVLSYGDLQRLRQTFTLEYNADHDRCMHPVWLQHKVESDSGASRQLRCSRRTGSMFDC